MNYWLERVQIAHQSFPRFIGGPLDGITNAPFRQLVRQFSSDNLLYTEIRHVACVAHERGSVRALNFDQVERPLNFQVTTNSIEQIPAACQKIQACGVDLVDVNLACPAKNVVKSQSGSALMADLKHLAVVLACFRQHTQVPLTVKMRAGFKHKNACEVASVAQDCGVDALAIHPRLQGQRFSGELDFELVAQIKKTVRIPVLYSGGIVDFSDAVRVYECTGVDGFLIGRALCAHPWKLAELEAHARGQSFLLASDAVLRCALAHLDLLLTNLGVQGLYCFRKHLAWYVAGCPHAASLRQKLLVSESVEEVREGLKEVLGSSYGPQNA